MFHVDLTFEDTRIIANSDTGSDYIVTISDNHSGVAKVIHLTSKQLGMIFAFNMDYNGEPEGIEQFYAELEPLFVGWPVELRPIP
jgi:hypothetical protein